MMGAFYKNTYWADFRGANDTPEILSTTVTNVSVATTSHVVTVPDADDIGQIYVVLSVCDFDSATTFDHGGWTTNQGVMVNETHGGVRVAVHVKSAISASNPLTFTTDASEKSAHIVYRIKVGHGRSRIALAGIPSTQPGRIVEISTRSTGTSANPNPPDFSPVSGSQNWLWIAACTAAAGTTTSAAPSGYSNLTQSTLSGADTVEIASATKSVSAASENPGTFTIGSSLAWVAFGVAVYSLWSEITGDVMANPAPTWSTGISGTGPLDRVSSPGRMTFDLNNASTNSAGLEGYYSPGHTNARAGFDVGTNVVVMSQYPSQTIAASEGFHYTLSSIAPIGGEFGSRRTKCTAHDVMALAANMTLRELAPLTNQDDDEVFDAIDAAVPFAFDGAAPIDGVDTYPYVFTDINSNATPMLELFQRLAQSSLGLVVVDTVTSIGNTYPSVRYDNRFSLMEAATAGGQTWDKTETMSLTVKIDHGQIFNVIDCITPTRRVDDEPTTVLCSIDSDRFVIGAGETLVVDLDYRDPSNQAEQVSGVDMVTPVAQTDFTMNSLPNGLGVDLTSDHTVTPTFQASNVQLSIANTGSVNSTVTKLQCRGRGVYEYQDKHMRAENATSIAKWGERPLSLRMPWQTDPNVCQQVADWLLTRNGDENAPGIRSARMVVSADTSDQHRLQVVASSIGRKINITEQVTGTKWVADEQWVVMHRKHRDVGAGIQTIVELDLQYWGVTDTFWRLGATADDELGVDTKLGYF